MQKQMSYLYDYAVWLIPQNDNFTFTGSATILPFQWSLLKAATTFTSRIIDDCTNSSLRIFGVIAAWRNYANEEHDYCFRHVTLHGVYNAHSLLPPPLPQIRMISLLPAPLCPQPCSRSFKDCAGVLRRASKYYMHSRILHMNHQCWCRGFKRF